MNFRPFRTVLKPYQELFQKSGVRTMLNALVHINSHDDNNKLFQDLKLFIQEYEQTGKDESS